MEVLVAQSCLSLWDPTDCSLQALLSMEFSRHKYWSGLPFSSPGVLPDPGIKPGSPALQVDSLPAEPPKPLGKSTDEIKSHIHKLAVICILAIILRYKINVFEVQD